MQEWNDAITAILAQTSGDDCTMSLTAIGWSDFETLRSSFTERAAYVESLGAELDRFDELIHAQQEQLARLDRARRECAQRQWENYRTNYVVNTAGRRSH